MSRSSRRHPPPVRSVARRSVALGTITTTNERHTMTTDKAEGDPTFLDDDEAGPLDMNLSVLPEDKPAQPVRQPQDDSHEQMVDTIPARNREDVVRHLHREAVDELADLRARRDLLEDQIRVLVGTEYRLRRMVAIADRANVEADPS